MDKAQLLATIKQICNEKNISVEAVHATIEAALAAAYRKDFGSKGQNIKVDFNLETGESKIFEVKEVIEDLPEEELARLEKEAAELEEEGELRDGPRKSIDHKEITFSKKPVVKDALKEDNKEGEESDEEPERKYNSKTMIQVSEAKKINKKLKVGEDLRTELDEPTGYGRMAAQTAKQVIIQKLREAERNVLFDEFKEREGSLLNGIIQRKEPTRLLIDLGNITAVMPNENQIPNERYMSGDRIKVYVVSVSQTTKGPEVIVSRAHENLIAKLFEMEIPEIASGMVVIKSVSREAGSRTKIAVYTEDDSIDAIGSCVGQKGARIQTIISEIGGEKIDIIEWDEDPKNFIINSLAPAKVDHLDLDKENKSAKIFVTNDQLSLAIGKNGQNVRLAVKLTGWNLNISEAKKTAEENKEIDMPEKQDEEKNDVKEEKIEEDLKEDPKKDEEK